MKFEYVTRLSGNANVIGKTLNVLKEELQQMKKVLIQRILENEVEKNRILKAEVELWKTKLTQLEIKNGKKQICTKAVVGVGQESKPILDEQEAHHVLPDQTTQNLDEIAKKQRSESKAQPKQQKQKSEPPAAAENIDVSRLDFRIGRIINVKKHPDADSLYVEEVELGEEKPRTVVSGLVKHVPVEEMQNRLVVLLCNLKPAKMRGILSEAMVMCASSPQKVEILIPPEGSCPGDRIQFESFPGEPDQQLNPKKKIFEQVAPDLKTDANRVATYKGVAFNVAGKGVVLAPTLAFTNIK